MASMKNGYLTSPREWWKHLRGMKRDFWKRERKAARRHALAESRCEGLLRSSPPRRQVCLEPERRSIAEHRMQPSEGFFLRRLQTSYELMERKRALGAILERIRPRAA